MCLFNFHYFHIIVLSCSTLGSQFLIVLMGLELRPDHTSMKSGGEDFMQDRGQVYLAFITELLVDKFPGHRCFWVLYKGPQLYQGVSIHEIFTGLTLSFSTHFLNLPLHTPYMPYSLSSITINVSNTTPDSTREVEEGIKCISSSSFCI